MNDAHPLTDHDLSAVLDQVADPGVTARAEVDAAAQARLGELRRARDAVRGATVRPLEADVVDRLVTTALDAATASGDGTGSPSPGARSDGAAEPVGASGHHHGPSVVTPLPRRSAGRRAPTWLVAAVVVVFLAIGLGLVWSGTRDHRGDVAFDQVGQSISGSAAESAAPGKADERTNDQGTAASGADASTTTATAATATPFSPDAALRATLVDLGSFRTADELRTRLKDTFPQAPVLSQRQSTAFDSTIGHRCSDQVKAVFSLDTQPTRQGAATVDGKRVLVFEYPFTADGGRATTLVVAVGSEACQPVLSFQR